MSRGMAGIFSVDQRDRARHCPMCGNRWERLYVAQSLGACVGCRDCGLEGPWVDGREFNQERRDAVRAWNDIKRAPRWLIRLCVRWAR